VGDEIVVQPEQDPPATGENDPWTPEEATRLAEDIYHGRSAGCPRCGGWVQGTVQMSAATLRKPMHIECGDCARLAEAFGGPDNEGCRVPRAAGEELERTRRQGGPLNCPFCGASMRLLRDELPSGGEIFAFDCLACGAAHYEAGGVL
jgi:hypothetical protein